MAEKNQLLRVLGIAFGFAAVVGSVIGQGILRSPGIVAEATNSPSIIIALWIAGAVITCLNACAFAELGSAIPRAGGPYAFIDRAFGHRAGVLAAMAMLVSSCATLAYLCFVVGEFLVRLGVGGADASPSAYGIVALILFGLLNSTGTRISGSSQIVLSTIKGAALIALVVLLFASPDRAVIEASIQPASGWLPFGTAIVVIITTFSGWWEITQYGEELENPGTTLPKALFGGILGVAALYVLINLAMLKVMSPAEMAGSKLVAGDAVGIVLGPKADFLLSCFGIISVGAIGNLALMSYSRLTFAVARAGILPASLSVVGKKGTPLRAMWSLVAIAAALILTGSYLTLVTLGETMFLTVLIGVALAVIRLRKSEPEISRPFRVPFYPATIYVSLLALLALLAIFVAQEPVYSLGGILLVGGGWAVHDLILRWRKAGQLSRAED